MRDQRTVGPAVRLSSRDRAHGASAPGPSLAGVRTWREQHEQGRQCRPAHCRVLTRTQVQLAGEGPRPPSRADGVSAPVAGRRASSVGQSPGQGVAWPLIPVWLLCRLLPAGQISQGVPCWGTGRPLPRSLRVSSDAEASRTAAPQETSPGPGAPRPALWVDSMVTRRTFRCCHLFGALGVSWSRRSEGGGQRRGPSFPVCEAGVIVVKRGDAALVWTRCQEPQVSRQGVPPSRPRRVSEDCATCPGRSRWPCPGPGLSPGPGRRDGLGPPGCSGRERDCQGAGVPAGFPRTGLGRARRPAKSRLGPRPRHEASLGSAGQSPQ